MITVSAWRKLWSKPSVAAPDGLVAGFWNYWAPTHPGFANRGGHQPVIAIEVVSWPCR